jgi:hypothetical protein
MGGRRAWVIRVAAGLAVAVVVLLAGYVVLRPTRYGDPGALWEFRRALRTYREKVADYPHTAAEAVAATQEGLSRGGIRIYLRDDGTIRIEDSDAKIDVSSYKYNGPDDPPDMRWRERRWW